MSSPDVYQSQLRNFDKVGLAKIDNFGDHDDTLIRFSPDGEAELKKMLSCMPLDMQPKFDQWIRIFGREAQDKLKGEIESAHINQATTSMHRSLELKFSVNVNSPLLTGDHIKGVGGVPIKVILVDSHTKEEVKSGPEASGRVKVVVLEGEVDGVRGEDGRNELDNILVGQMEGKKSRVGIVCLNLIEGTALLPLVSFTRNSKWMKISTFRLAARFMDNFNGVRVKEAKTEPFVLKDRRTACKKQY